MNFIDEQAENSFLILFIEKQKKLLKVIEKTLTI